MNDDDLKDLKDLKVHDDVMELKDLRNTLPALSCLMALEKGQVTIYHKLCLECQGLMIVIRTRIGNTAMLLRNGQDD